MTSRISGLVTCAAFLLLAVCQNPGEPADVFVSADQTGSVEVAFNSAINWSADPLRLDSARVANDTLLVFATHGGGCARHRYAAIANNGWLESHPVQVGVIIAHQDNDDACDAIINARLRFDLAPLRDAYRRSYGTGSAELIIRLSEATVLNRAPLMIRYSF